MSVNALTVILLVLLAACRVGAAPFNDGFASAQAHQYILNYEELRYDLGFEKVQEMKGKYCLRLRNENQRDAKFVPQSVVAGQQYEVSFRSLFVNVETLENNPTLEETTRPGWKLRYRYLPTFEIVFLDKDRTPLQKTTIVALPYGVWRLHQDVFMVPPKAEFVQFAFASGINNGVLYIDDIRFTIADARQEK